MGNSYERMMEAAEKLHGLTQQAEVGRLIDQYDQIMTNWKTRGIPNKELLNIAEKLGCDPFWLRDGVGSMTYPRPAQLKIAQPISVYESLIEDLSVLSPEDVEIFKQDIKLAAMKERRKQKEKRDRESANAPDPPLEARRTT